MFKAVGALNPVDLLGNDDQLQRESTKSKRTGQPVRRNSGRAGRCEGVFWRKINRQEARRIVLAAEKYDVQTKREGVGQGRKNGALGPVALEVLRLLANLVDFRSGRLDPSLDFLMAKTARSRAAIVRGLQALRRHGFLDWLRRYVPTGNEGRGPQVVQTSNAYRLSLPERAKRLLGRMMGQSPVPDDYASQRAAQAAERDAYVAALPMAGQLAFQIEDEALAASLARLWEGIQKRKERESSGEPESRAKFLSKGN